MRPALARQGHFSCLDGARRGPLEDSGGIWGYQRMCQVLADPHHPDYEGLADWYAAVAPADPPFDPEVFDLDAVNQRLERLSLVLSSQVATAEEVAAIVRPVQWLLQRVGCSGPGADQGRLPETGRRGRDHGGAGWCSRRRAGRRSTTRALCGTT